MFKSKQMKLITIKRKKEQQQSTSNGKYASVFPLKKKTTKRMWNRKKKSRTRPMLKMEFHFFCREQQWKKKKWRKKNQTKWKKCNNKLYSVKNKGTTHNKDFRLKHANKIFGAVDRTEEKT